MKLKWRDKSPPFNKLEEYALWISLLAIIVLNLFSPVLPALDIYFSQNFTSSLYLIALLMIAKILLKKIEKIRVIIDKQSTPASNFNDEIQQLFKRHPKSGTIDILAADANKFYHAIEDAEFETDRIRILVYHNSNLLQRVSNQWDELYNNGRIRQKLEIKKYKATPITYSILIDGTDGFFGFFYPTHLKNGVMEDGQMKITGQYLIKNTNPAERQIINGLQDRFDSEFKDYAEKFHCRNR